MSHGNAHSVRECGCHKEFKPGLLPHLLARLLVIKSYSLKEKSRELGANHHCLGLLMYAILEKTNTVLKILYR
jgi:hypothetical protein